MKNATFTLLMIIAVVTALMGAGCTLRTMPESQDSQTTSTVPAPSASPAASTTPEDTSSVASTADLDTALEELEMVE